MIDLPRLRKAGENLLYFVLVAFTGAVFGIMIILMLTLDE